MATVALITISSIHLQIVRELKYTLTKRSFILANQRQRTRSGIVAGEGGDAAVQRWGGDRWIWCEGHCPPLPSGGKRKTRSPVGGNDDDNKATVHDKEPCYNALVDALEQGGDLHSSSASSLPSLPCVTLASGPPRTPPCPGVVHPYPYALSPH